jgi:putative transposase
VGVPAGARRTLTLGVKVAASTVWEILREAGIDPAPDRTATTWTQFLRSQAEALLAADFIETVTLTGTRMYILAVIEHASRRIRILGATAHPSAAWVTQTARNLVMDIEDARCRVKHLIRDRDGKYPALFDAVLADAGITVVLGGIQMPRMNAVMERWVRTCRRELLDRTLIFNQRHLLYALREYEFLYNTHRPHQGIANARPLTPAARTNHRPAPARAPEHPPTRPPRRHPPRVRTRRLTCPDDILGKYNVNFASGSSLFAQPQQVAGGAFGVQGVDPFLLIYLNEGPEVHTPVVRTGMMMLDFPGGGLIDKIISLN